MVFDWLRGIDWQTWAAILTVTAAGWWLLRRVRQTVSKAIHMTKGQVSGCGHCPRNPATSKSNDVVPLESIGTKKSPKS